MLIWQAHWWKPGVFFPNCGMDSPALGNQMGFLKCGAFVTNGRSLDRVIRLKSRPVTEPSRQ